MNNYLIEHQITSCASRYKKDYPALKAVCFSTLVTNAFAYTGVIQYYYIKNRNVKNPKKV